MQDKQTDLVADSDVAVVGAGPVGLIIAILLANRGHQVALIDRWPEPYALPRATGITHEILRCLQVAKVIDDVRPDILFTEDGSRRFEMRTGAGEVLTVRVDQPTSASGWPERASFSQPRFERTVNEAARAHPNIRMLRGWNVIATSEDGAQAIAEAVAWPPGSPGGLQVRARYLVGSDGANSVVRSGELASMQDLGFAHDWLVVDVVLPEGRVVTPHLAQIFGPPRPTTMVSGGPGGRRRWEFMRLEGEPLDELNSAETAWRLLADFDVHPDNAVLERHNVYTFRGRWSTQWRSGRRVLAGDAAHLMPVFLGEGFNSGIRDAAALAWRLDLILRGIVPDAVLDSYVSERLGHVRQVVEQAVQAGQIICVLDAERAAERDARLRVRPDVLMPEDKRRDWRLGEGLWRTEDPHAGYLGVQGRVAAAGAAGLFDDVIDHRGFVLLGVDDDPGRLLSPAVRTAWERIGGISAHIARDTPIADVDGTYATWFAERGIVAAVFRPDYYVFGTAASMDDTDALVRDLVQRLGVLRPAAATRA
jgi:resorcinol 4-hydroxylase (NADPH)